MSGIPYVPGVNYRLMEVDGYTRKYIVWVPPGGVPAGSPVVFMLHGGSGDGGLSSDVPLSSDPRRVFVAGFSSGGGMCARIGVEASDLIAAVACHSSGLQQVHETLVGSRNLSAFFTLGTEQIPQIKGMISVNLDSFNLESAPLTTTTGPASTQLHAQVAQPGNGDGNELFFTFLDDVRHQYPDTVPDFAWPFFERHPRP